jgi:hypothetical protein
LLALGLHRRGGEQNPSSFTERLTRKIRIYAHDPLHDEYLLLTILGPDAHSRQQWGSFLRDIEHNIVDPWVKGKVVYTDPDEKDE